MTGAPVKYDAETLQERILTFRDQKVILDADLARIYGVATKVLNQAVKRNADRFPPDFLFTLSTLGRKFGDVFMLRPLSVDHRAPAWRGAVSSRRG